MAKKGNELKEPGKNLKEKRLEKRTKKRSTENIEA